MQRKEIGKSVIITGVTQGLGRAMVDRFDELGWNIYGCGRSKDKIEELKKQYSKIHDFQVIDVSDSQQVNNWANYILNRHTAPDMIVNNASIVNQNAQLWKITAQEFENVMNVNVNGVVNVIRAFVPTMVARKEGIIINMSSSWGREGEAELAPYCASKFAIEGITKSMALELPHGMAVVALDPGGSISTPMLKSCAPQYINESPTPETWSHKATQYILNITIDKNGDSLTCPACI
ncbi:MULTISPECIES: SDR family oxidoreductase [Bacillus]|uniref:Short-chain dehydrogenase n=3 Tax=Bacillus thuringiensis TaxID=1428 RepID=A0A1W6WM41_BACTU|nr:MULTISPECIES: SDR family NAD(P)-dependent oxidoreductase [Bacillus]MEC2878269.1 SDR family NAD(P)-dependent oxidoreductase [Bacillus cereus]AEA15922.1 Short chain dehydrogenase [Bacillus thuringiensis serovar chinensis CT-43]AFV18048.1 short-chain dehydrogenase/reductase SDR [Bacillus thuringiensis Bt407]AGG00990.1 3-oxoacyl-[acyl-carrier protein] reductase [Bacillus thuringiensis serovar thuringiensis str. IS5056]ARP57636.1 short-chain dehydrogenase [Bacillus thuringiensis]